MTSPPPPLTSVGELGPLVARMLATDPEARPPTALHVSAELARMSLLSPDPATEKARVPELAELAVVGFGQVTVQLIDRTTPTPMADRGARDTIEGPWTAPTRLTAPALDLETPEDEYPEFGDEIPTTAEHRPDTIIDARILDEPSDGLVETELDGPADIPTTVSAPPRRDSFGVEPRTDELARATRPVSLATEAALHGSAETGPADAASDDTGDTALGLETPDATEDEVAFADTRIRPAHLDPDVPPGWAAVHPTRVGVTSGVRDGAMMPPRNLDADDGPTRLSLLPPDEGDGDDRGDGDTALDLSLDEVNAVTGDRPGFVDPPRAPAPPAPRSKDRLLLGLLLAASLVVAAAVAYALVADDPTVIQIPSSPGAPAPR